jgi:hypothetical protein
MLALDMIPKDQKKENKLMIVHSDGHSHPLVGDIQEKRFLGSEDLLPSHISMGWMVKEMTPFGDGKVLVLLEKESNM